MITKYLFRVMVLLLIPFIFYTILTGFNKTEEVSNVITLTDTSGFLNIIYNFDLPEVDIRSLQRNAYRIKDSLHFNSVQLYGNVNSGGFNDPINSYKDYVKRLMDTVGNYNLSGVYGRDKIWKLCNAQSIVYEVVQTPGDRSVNNGFCYQGRDNNVCSYITDSGRTVLKSSTNPADNNSAGWLCKDIYENMQHGDLIELGDVHGDTLEWIIKPMMRIDSSVVDNTPNLPVAAVVVKNYGGGMIDSVIIRAKHFAHDTNGSIYGGQYIDVFSFTGDTSLTVSGSMKNLQGLNYWVDWRYWVGENDCKVDFKVYWFGLVNVWFDKMTVNNQMGEECLSGIHDTKIIEEVNEFWGYNSMLTFFEDEMVYSNIPCIRHVRDVIKSTNPNAKLIFCSATTRHCYGMKNDTVGLKLLLDAIPTERITVDCHEITGGKVPPQFNNVYAIPPEWQSKNNEDYNNFLQNRVIGHRHSRTDELTWWYDDKPSTYLPSPYGSLVYQLVQGKQEASSRALKLIFQPQINMFGSIQASTGDYYIFIEREPVNEEIEAQAWISLAHGADGLCWFVYQSYMSPLRAWQTGDNTYKSRVYPNGPGGDPSDTMFCIGLLEPCLDTTNCSNVRPRTENIYGQNKWDYVAAMNLKIQSLKPTIDDISWQSGWSVHTEGANHQCISDIKSIYRNSSSPYEFNPGNLDGTKYWEMGFYEPKEVNLGYIKYIFMVNRRCVPETTPGVGDIRQLKIKFNPEILLNHDSWTLTDVRTGSLIQFYKDNQGSDGFVDLGNDTNSPGYFNPGEGKLFRVEPTIIRGGTLMGDETISSDIICYDTVYNNGYNITVEGGAHIQFANSSTFIMEGGGFTVGDSSYYGAEDISFDAVNGSHWPGFTFTDCNVGIFNSSFSGFDNNNEDTLYALNMIDCPIIKIRGNTFSGSSDNYIGSIGVTYYNYSGLENVYVGDNSIGLSQSIVPAISIMSYAGLTIPLIVENNSISSSTASSTAIFLSGITGGAIKTNTISGFETGINLLSCAVDVYRNTISSELENATGIFAASGTEIRMNPSEEIWLGGLNQISNTGTGSKNIYVKGASFLLDGGENIFNVVDENDYHLYGYFPDDIEFTADETINCFKLDDVPVNPPYNYVTLGKFGSQIEFTFTPYLSGCESQGGEGMMVINLGYGIYDTVMTEGGGGGGGKISDLRFEIADLKAKSKAETKTEAKADNSKFKIENSKFILNPEQLYDSISILMRYRNYTNAKSKCYELINAYPDSIQSINAISKLFLALTASDTTQNAVSQLKTYYESLILNNSDNVSLVMRCNYFVQKCKVRLHQYTSALAGFQQIINENPYSYEGLVARWDYMATSLLMQGQGGSESSETSNSLPRNLGVKSETDLFNEYNETDDLDDDKSPFTKEERVTIKKSINDAIEITKDISEKQIEILEKESDIGNDIAKRELQKMNIMKRVIKTEKPKNIIEHINIIRADIQKIFGGLPSNNKKTNNILPAAYKLAQNYPNPFNPATTIKYEVPKDSKVKLVIYDILGREVKILVHNEIKSAGYYKVEFNMQNYASGVYFYRIETDDLKGGKFVDAKKMVLIK